LEGRTNIYSSMPSSDERVGHSARPSHSLGGSAGPPTSHADSQQQTSTSSSDRITHSPGVGVMLDGDSRSADSLGDAVVSHSGHNDWRVHDGAVSVGGHRDWKADAVVSWSDANASRADLVVSVGGHNEWMCGQTASLGGQPSGSETNLSIVTAVEQCLVDMMDLIS